MQISKLKLVNYRNYENQVFEFSPKRNIIIGNNGVGKTNIVEAIYVLALTKSFRVTNDNLLIKLNEEYSIIEGKVLDKINNDYKIIIDKKTKRVFINNNQIKKLSDYISNINIILFSSEDLKLIKDSPGVHRKLINMELSQLNNQYLKTLSIYNKILKQRNTYLKSISKNQNNSQDFLYILTEKLIDYGLEVFNLRKDYIENINDYLNGIFKEITSLDGITLKYISDFEELSKEDLIKKYNATLKSDLKFGNTNFGIHLDDFVFYFEDKVAKNFLSEGEQKNTVVSFKLAEIKVFEKLKKSVPILILDDLFSELDNDKIEKILKYLDKDMQIFITTTDLNKIDKSTIKNSKVFNLENNNIEVKVYE